MVLAARIAIGRRAMAICRATIAGVAPTIAVLARRIAIVAARTRSLGGAEFAIFHDSAIAPRWLAIVPRGIPLVRRRRGPHRAAIAIVAQRARLLRSRGAALLGDGSRSLAKDRDQRFEDRDPRAKDRDRRMTVGDRSARRRGPPGKNVVLSPEARSFGTKARCSRVEKAFGSRNHVYGEVPVCAPFSCRVVGAELAV